MLLWHLEMRSSDTLIVCQFLLVIACILRGIKRLQNIFHVDPCIRILFAWHVPKYVLCNYFCDISGQFSHSDLSSVLLSVMLCMSRSLDRRPCFQFSKMENPLLSVNGKIRIMGGRNLRDLGHSQVLRWPNAQMNKLMAMLIILWLLLFSFFPFLSKKGNIRRRNPKISVTTLSPLWKCTDELW